MRNDQQILRRILRTIKETCVESMIFSLGATMTIIGFFIFRREVLRYVNNDASVAGLTMKFFCFMIGPMLMLYAQMKLMLRTRTNNRARFFLPVTNANTSFTDSQQHVTESNNINP